MTAANPQNEPLRLKAWRDSPEAKAPPKRGNPAWYRGMPESPNPKGRPRGQTKQTKLMQRMLDDAGNVVDAVLEKAKEGDAASANLVLSRILPALRSQSEKVTFDFDPAASVSRQVEQVLAAIAGGEVAPDTAKLIIEAVQALSQIRAVEDLETRIAQLEERQS